MERNLFWRRPSTVVVLREAQYGQNGRLMRWALVLQQYQFTLRAIKGSENVGADFLSRHSVTRDVRVLCDGMSICLCFV